MFRRDEFTISACGASGAAAAIVLILLSACEQSALQGYESSQATAEDAASPMQAQAAAGMMRDTPKEPIALGEAKSADISRGGLKEAEIYRGSGVMTRGTGARRATAGLSGDGRVTLNFVNVEIREVVDLVLGDTLELNYIIDPKVQGTVTARTSQPLERAAVIPALENILALNGAALVLVDGVYRVVTLQEAGASLSRPLVSPTHGQLAQGFGIHIIPLEFVSATEMREILTPFVGPGRVLRVDQARNLLIFAGGGSEAHDLLQMAEVFDVDWMAGMSFALFPVEFADPEALVRDLEAVFLQDGQSPLAGLVRFMPIERMNAVMAITSRPAYLDRVELWVSRLDRGEEGTGRRIFVYNVENGRAAEMAEVLSEVFQTGGARDREAPSASFARGITPVEISGAPERAVAERSNQAAEGAGQPAREGAAAPRSNRRLPGPTAPSDAGPDVAGLIDEGGDIRIIADERINALVILATPAEYRMIEATLKRLDVQPLQVFIEATIADVTLNDELRYGLQWFFNRGSSAVTFSALSSGDVASLFPGFSYLLSAADARVVLNALTEITDVKVVSSPQLMVLDNQSARLQVGDEVPIATQSAVSVSDPDSPIVNSIQFRDTGVILEVTPRVNASGLVVLDIMQEVSSVVATSTSDLDSPTIQQRRIETTVAVHSGDTIALGGLIRDDETEGITGVPILSAIPILGNLFKTTSKIKFRQELLIMITPRVVRNRLDAKGITEELRRRLRKVAPLEKKVGLTN